MRETREPWVIRPKPHGSAGTVRRVDHSGLPAIQLPDGLAKARTTPRFDEASVPAGLLRSHRIAAGVWGVLQVLEGEVTFVLEHAGTRRTLRAGEDQVIQPDTSHHVELGAGAAFEIDFYR